MATKKSNFYLTREQLIQEIVISKRCLRESNYPKTPSECFTPKLTEYLQLMVNKYANKAQWRNYSYIDDMKSEALLTLMQNAFKYNEEKYDNPFGYYTQIIKFSFITSLEKEEVVRDIKDSLWESIGMTPSYARQLKNEMLQDTRDTSTKSLKARKKDVDIMQEKIDNIGRLASRISRIREPSIDIDFEISELLEIDLLPFTGDMNATLTLYSEIPSYEIQEGIEIENQIMKCLSVRDQSTRSETKRVIPDTSDVTITLALCSIGLAVRRDLMVKKLREISGFNMTPRYPIEEKVSGVEPDVAFSEYPPETTKRKKKRVASV
jgi:hypothetical protein